MGASNALRLLLAATLLAFICAAPAKPGMWLDVEGVPGAQITDADAVQSAVAVNSKPFFCMGLDCPDFDVLETSGDLQLRRYRSARYVVTHVEAESLLQAQLEGTKRLLAYLSGDNEDRRRLMPPTVPLETILFPADSKSETVEGRYCIALYLPERAQDRPPKPTDRRVHVFKARSSDWFVLKIRTSLIDERAIIRKAWGFIRELQDVRGKCAVNPRVVSFGVYDLPVPFLKPGYFEIAVPRRHKGKCEDPEPTPAPAPGGGDDPEGGDDFGVDGCEACGDCGDDPEPPTNA